MSVLGACGRWNESLLFLVHLTLLGRSLNRHVTSDLFSTASHTHTHTHPHVRPSPDLEVKVSAGASSARTGLRVSLDKISINLLSALLWLLPTAEENRRNR